MTAPAPSPTPAKRSKRMVVWMVTVPVVILLLALAGANWKFFHLAYAKHLIASTDSKKQTRGIKMVAKTHLRKGMTLEEVRAILAPAKVAIEGDTWYFDALPPLRVRGFRVSLEGDRPDFDPLLGFDEDGKLHRIIISEEGQVTDILQPGK